MLRNYTYFAAVPAFLVLVGCGSSSSDGADSGAGPAASAGAAGAGGGSATGGAAGTGGSSAGTAGNPAAGSSGAGATAGASAGGASGAAGTGGVAPTSLLNDGLPASCSPLREQGACLTPFPNSIYLKADTTTKTGKRVNLAMETLPVEAMHNTPLDPTRFNMADGFSPATPIVTYFPERIDPKSLPPITDPTMSLSASSATVIVDMATNQLVAHFSEVDATASTSKRQSLMMRPTTRLLPSHQYAVAVTNSIKTSAGGLPTPPPQYVEIAAGNGPSDELSIAQAARMPAILSSLTAAGVDTTNVLVAWDFETASDEWVTGNVVAMRDQAFAVVGDKGAGYGNIVVADPNPNPDHLIRRIDGTIKVPQFLTSVEQTVADTSLTFDANGLPKSMGNNYDVKFAAIIPKSAMIKPARLMVFGHGLLGSGPDYLNITELQEVADMYNYVMVATDWTGLSTWESPLTMNGNGAAEAALADFNNLHFITDRLQQALINAMVLTRTANGMFATDATMTIEGTAGGTPVLDSGPPVYFGISLGGIMGGSFMGYTPDVPRGVINVAGSTWSLMFQRSSNWQLFHLIIAGSYPDYLDQQILLALSQSQFDFSDPINTAPHLIANPLPGSTVKNILQQMSVNDAQVPNIASEILARTMGLSMLNDSDTMAYGLATVAPPQSNVLSVFDLMPTTTPPLTNEWIPDNGAHAGCSMQPDAQKQIDEFLRNGDIKSYCDGTCDPE